MQGTDHQDGAKSKVEVVWWNLLAVSDVWGWKKFNPQISIYSRVGQK